jgi:hypothetical protein
MNLTWNYAGRLSGHGRDEADRVDFSYLFGRGPAAVRHDPHVATQGCAQEPGLLELSRLVRDRSEQAA